MGISRHTPCPIKILHVGDGSRPWGAACVPVQRHLVESLLSLPCHRLGTIRSEIYHSSAEMVSIGAFRVFSIDASLAPRTRSSGVTCDGSGRTWEDGRQQSTFLSSKLARSIVAMEYFCRIPTIRVLTAVLICIPLEPRPV